MGLEVGEERGYRYVSGAWFACRANGVGGRSVGRSPGVVLVVVVPLQDLEEELLAPDKLHDDHQRLVVLKDLICMSVCMMVVNTCRLGPSDSTVLSSRARTSWTLTMFLCDTWVFQRRSQQR